MSKNKLEKKYILFDLDGTLTDSGIGIINSVEYALGHYNIKVEDRNTLRKFLGPPLQYSFTNFYDFNETNVDEVIVKYREYYSTKGIFENKVYDGVENMLQTLKDTGKTLIVATSKPTFFSEQILKHFNLDKYFVYLSGAEMDGSRAKKGDIIKHALDTMNITDLNDVIMIGDREHDIIGAKEHGIQSIGVLYGYGSTEEFKEAGADYIVSKPEEILEILL